MFTAWLSLGAGVDLAGAQRARGGLGVWVESFRLRRYCLGADPVMVLVEPTRYQAGAVRAFHALLPKERNGSAV